MIPPAQFLERWIRPTLEHLAVVEPRLGGRAAEQLMLGTAIAESGLDALVQKGGGPAPAAKNRVMSQELQGMARQLGEVQGRLGAIDDPKAPVRARRRNGKPRNPRVPAWAAGRRCRHAKP